MEKFFSVNEQGVSIHCKIYCEDMRSIKRAVLFGSGFGGHKDTRAASRLAARMLKRNKNIALIAFDWPCHGDDASPQLRLEVCDHYLSVLLDYIRKRFRTEELYGTATSFGGYLYLKYIYEHGSPFKKTVLRCPAVNMYESLTSRIITSDEIETIEKGRPAQVGFDRKIRLTRDFLTDLQKADITTWDFSPYAADITIIHGDKDEIIDHDTDWFFAEENGITFHTVENADHRFTDPVKMDLAIKLIVEGLGLN